MGFSFVQITDHHLTESASALVRGFSTAYSFRAVIRHIADTVGDRADFIVSTGDLVEPPYDAAYQTLIRTLNIGSNAQAAPGPLPVTIEGLHEFPMYLFPGNHDDRSLLSKILSERALGSSSPKVLFRESEDQRVGGWNFAFTHRGVQFIFVDWGPDAKAAAAPGMFEFLCRALESELPSVILMHHHPAPVGVRWLDEFIADDIGRFWDIVTGKSVLGVLCGHVHMTRETVIAGIPVFSLRSTMFQFARRDRPLICLEPPHYRLVTIQDGLLTSRVFEVPL
jgi:Icc protein